MHGCLMCVSQGSPTDMITLKANLHALYPSLECRFSVANEVGTSVHMKDTVHH
jgi:hypothetical protein